ncbi:hypothetical protein J8281_12030 [Aquimarina sp. U1-2]|uniref:hypothetical protein n=1 Tax=Aquimarina sp. U1-2 TaxID=2823141 RepID=UPI001AECF1DC|nr:hypothetical protein [Aquimarina sp. U1-2]MBP2832915.1 hypothetical protein [Aquimarina sp. U1-2]
MRQVFLLFSLLFSWYLGAQDFIELQTKTFNTHTSSFHIERVIDDRKEKNLGLHNNLNGEKVILQLKPNGVAAVEKFMNLSFKKELGTTSIYIRIHDLNVQETRRNTEEVISRAAVDLSFCEMKNGRLKELYRIQRNEDQIFAANIFGFAKTIKDVYLTHEKRLRAALEYAILAFVEYQNAEQKDDALHFDTSNFDEGKDNELNKWYNIVEYRQIVTSTYHEGWAVGYTGFLDRDKGFIIPFEINIELYDVKEDFARKEGFEFVDATVIRPGIFGYKKIFPGVYGAVGVNIPIGLEVKRRLETDRDIYKFLVGVSSSQGIKIIPWKAYGLVLGVEFFQQFQNSEIYTSDIGLEVSFGINF